MLKKTSNNIGEDTQKMYNHDAQPSRGTKGWTVEEQRTIPKTCLYNFDPLKPHFYLVELGFTEVDIIFSYFWSKP